MASLSGKSKSNTRTKLASIFQKPVPKLPVPKSPVPPSPLSFAPFASFAPVGGGGGGGGGSNSPPIGAPGSAPEPEDNRLVLVFDIDATLVDTDFLTTVPTLEESREYLALPGIMNQRILDKIIVPAAKLRSEGKIAAILVLSNNGMPAYIAAVCEYIAHYVRNEIGPQKPGRFRNVRPNTNKTVEKISEYFFDYVMTRDTDGRDDVRGNPVKRLEDVAKMLRFLGLSTYDLRSRTFMFDDLRGHQIQSELGPNYILIRSDKGADDGYKFGSKDITDYSLVLERFIMLKGPTHDPNTGEMPTPTLNNIANAFGNKELAGGRRRRKQSRKMKLKKNLMKKRKTYRRRQRGGGQYCAKKEYGKVIDYVYCAAECDSEGTCSPYS